MKPAREEPNRRILVIDDHEAIHADFRKTLCRDDEGEAVQRLAAELFEPAAAPRARSKFELVSASQGEEGVAAARAARAANRPFALAFVDIRMPPGCDGIETTARLWEVDPDLQIVLCTAYSDHSWEEMTTRLGVSDRLVILKKPFDMVEVLQLANAFTEKWGLLQKARSRVQDLERAVDARTRELQAANEQLRAESQERQQVVHALRATQARLHHFLAKSPAVLYSLRVEAGQLLPVWVSDNVANFLGVDAPAWQEQTLTLAYVEEADREAVNTSLEALLTKNSLSLQYRVRSADARVRWVRDDRQLLRDGAGQPVEIVGCWTDITEQQRLEAELRQAQKMESVGQLAGGVAHDFNNLLTIIRCHVELLLVHEPLPAAATESLQEVLNATGRASDLTRQLLAFSRKQLLRPQTLDLNALVSDVTRLLRRTLGEHITIVLQLAPGPACVNADAGLIQQAILNLAANARDAMPDGGRLIFSTSVSEGDTVCRGRPRDARPGRFVCLTVTDEGCGIPREHLPRLFEPFFTTKGVGKGTGLGLASVYGILRQHEGWVEVDSQPGTGTTFRLFLPAAAALPQAAARVTPEGRSARSGRETILVVEDEASLRAVLCATLQRLGYVVHVAADGVEALEVYAPRLGEIDLVLTDIVMPGGTSGWELGRKLQEQKPALKVIYMSGYNTEMAAHPSLPAAPIHFLPKPCSPQALADAVRRCLEEVAHPGGPAGAGGSASPTGPASAPPLLDSDLDAQAGRQSRHRVAQGG